jgi:hypothetical protein
VLGAIDHHSAPSLTTVWELLKHPEMHPPTLGPAPGDDIRCSIIRSSSASDADRARWLFGTRRRYPCWEKLPRAIRIGRSNAWIHTFGAELGPLGSHWPFEMHRERGDAWTDASPALAEHWHECADALGAEVLGTGRRATAGPRLLWARDLGCLVGWHSHAVYVCFEHACWCGT